MDNEKSTTDLGDTVSKLKLNNDVLSSESDHVSKPEDDSVPKISKGKAKKDAKKEAKKEMKNQAAKEKSTKAKTPAEPPNRAQKDGASRSAVEDPDFMFKAGFLADVYNERPKGKNGIDRVVTRCESLTSLTEIVIQRNSVRGTLC